ncbi:MAG: peptidyl-prolyl cis-trans isomerase [bacterium]
MFEFIRKHAPSVIIFVVIAFIGTIFLVWGFGGKQEGRNDVIATVFEKEITMPEYYEERSRIHQHYQNIYKDKWNSQLADQLNIKEMALDNLITKYVLLNAAEENKIIVTDNEAMAYIRAMPIFQRDGVFDLNLYHQRLRIIRTTPEKFQEDIRRSLLIDKLRDTVIGGIKVTESELKERYARYHEQVKFKYILISPDKVGEEGDVTVDESRLKEYYEEHKGDYTDPEQRKIEYLKIDYNRFKKDIKITEDEIAKYYQRNQNKFSTPKRVRASHILIKTSPQDAKEEEEKKRKKIEELLEKVKAGEDFHKLARENSECPSATKGGDLDYFEKGKMDPAFEKAAFGLAVGDVSGIVKSRFGYHIIKVEDIKPERLNSLEEVRFQIEMELRNAKAWEQAMLRAEDALRQIYKKKVFRELEEDDKVVYGHTEFFRKGEEINGIGKIAVIESAAFNLKKGKPSSFIKTAQGYFILNLLDIIPPKPQELDEVKGQIVEVLKQERARAQAKELAQKIKERLDAHEKLEDIASEKNFTILESDLILRGGYIPGLGRADVFGESLFILPIGSYTNVAEFDQGYCIARLEERVSVDEEEYKKFHESLLQDLLKEKQQQLFEAWTDRVKSAAKSAAKIEIIHQSFSG